MILLSRTRFFLLLFLLLAGPLLAPRLLWLAGSRHTIGTMAFVGHDGLGSALGISTYPVIFFQLGKDSIFFNGMNGYGYKPGDRVPVRYSLNHPADARIDQPLSLWGQTGVNLLLPVIIWFVILLTPARFDPLIPPHSKLLIRWKKPFIKIIPRFILMPLLVLLFSYGSWAQGKDKDPAALHKDTVMLKKATVTSARPAIIQRPDRIIVNVDALLSTTGMNALELMERLPGVVVDVNGQISFNGRTGVLVLIDDRPTYLSAADLAVYLRAMPADLLDKIELMSNPPAKYDAASGAGVINIRTKKGKEKGFNAVASASAGQAIYPRTSESVNLNWRIGKFNFFGNYSYNRQKQYRRVDIQRLNTSDGSLFDEISWYKPIRQNQTAKAGLDYSPNTHTTIGVVLTGIFSTTTNHSPVLDRSYDAHQQLDSFITADNSSRDHFSNKGVNLNFSHSFHQPGAMLTGDADYIHYVSNGSQLFLNNTYSPDSILLYNTNEQAHLPTGIHIYTAKTDLNLPLKRKIKLEAGAKLSSVSSDNTAGYFYLEGSMSIPDNDKTNRFKYTENIQALYASLSREYRRVSWQGGLRLENTRADGHQLGNTVRPDSAFSRQYINLFPTAYLSYKLDTAGKQNLRLSYGRRINRPSYQDLNPFIFLINKFTYISGNPYLKPQYSDNFEMAWSYKNRVTATLFYNHTADVQQEVIKQTGLIFISQTGNIGHRNNPGLSVNAQLQPLHSWSANVFAQLLNSRYDGFIGDSLLQTNTLTGSLNINNQFALKNGWVAELSGMYMSRATDGQFVKAAVWMLNTGVQKKVLHQKGSVRLAARDIFHTFVPKGSLTNIPGVTASYHNYVDTQVLTAAFSYTFSSGKTAKTRKTGSSEEEQGRIKN